MFTERSGQIGDRGTQPIGANRERRGRVVELTPGFGGFEAVSFEPSGHQPARMRERDRQVVERGLARCGVAWRQRETIPFAADAAKDGIHQRRRTALTLLLRQVHRIVDDRRCWNASEVQQLEHRQPQDIDDLCVEPGERSIRERGDQVIEGPLPAERAGGDLTGERAIAFVRK